jgi:hypothetical protein
MPISEGDKRWLRIGGIIVGVAVVGLILFNVLSGGGGGGTAGTPRRTPSPTATVTPSPGGTPIVPPVAQFGGRDPFSTPPEFLVGPPPSSGTSSSSSPGGSPSPPSGTGSSPPPTQPGGGSSANLGGHSVVLLDVFTRNGVGHAQVEIDGTVYTVTVDESFGPGNRFELRSVSGNCGTFVFGDESFTLCITPSK